MTSRFLLGNLNRTEMMMARYPDGIVPAQYPAGVVPLGYAAYKPPAPRRAPRIIYVWLDSGTCAAFLPGASLAYARAVLHAIRRGRPQQAGYELAYSVYVPRALDPGLKLELAKKRRSL